MGGRRLRAFSARRGLFPWTIVVLWLLIGIAISPLAFMLTDAQTNDAAAFLPKEAESTRVLDAQRGLPGGDAIPAVVVLARDGGLTAGDLAVTETIRAKLNEFSATALPPPIPSPDQRAVLITIPMPQTSDAERFTGDVHEMRDVARRAAAREPGLDTAVTGPAGLIADTYDVFARIEGALLVVTACIVAVILLVVYRSPFLWVVPLVSVGIADQTAAGLIYLLAEHGDLTVNGQSAGMLRVLVFGAGTDYALLLIARYREELTRHAEPATAMRIALRRAGPAILASAGTVIIGMLCLLLGELNSHRGLGPVCAIGIAVAFVTMTTLLPAAMVVGGRRLFWPFIPRLGQPDLSAESGAWARVGAGIGRRPRTIWITTVVALGALVVAVLWLPGGLRQDQAFRDDVDAVAGQQLAARSFPPGATAPTFVVAKAARADEVTEATRATPGVAAAVENGRAGELVQLLVVLDTRPDSPESFQTVRQLRANVHALPGADAIVGGNTAVNLDVRDAAVRDRQMIIPAVLVIVLLILGLLLRAIVAPLVLMGTVVLSFFAALGASALIYRFGFGFPGVDPALPLLGFIFLVALGVDYNIFLMTRVREEAGRIGHRAGVRRGLAVTGGVITSAGVVLAATFSVLLIFPLVQLAEVGLLVAFGVLLDTLVVRSVLVPALALDIGPAVWWPSRAGRGRPPVPVPIPDTHDRTGPLDTAEQAGQVDTAEQAGPPDAGEPGDADNPGMAQPGEARRVEAQPAGAQLAGARPAPG